jgi:hypothetical protein
MTKNIYNRLTSQSRPRAVRLTPEIIEYLCVPTKQGASRLLAYLSLVQSAVESTTPYTPLYGRTFDMETGQLVLSITDMAKRWNWARETVRKFLDRLGEFRLLSMEKLDRCTLVTMNLEWLDDGYSHVLDVPFLSFEMPHPLADKMSDWLSGDIADDELLEEIGAAVEIFDGGDAGVSPNLIAALQYSLIRQLIREWAMTHEEIPVTPDKNCGEIITEIFFSLMSGNWNLRLCLLDSYRPGGSSGTGLSDAGMNTPLISDGRAMLDSLFNHLNVVFDRDTV